MMKRCMLACCLGMVCADYTSPGHFGGYSDECGYSDEKHCCIRYAEKSGRGALGKQHVSALHNSATQTRNLPAVQERCHCSRWPQPWTHPCPSTCTAAAHSVRAAQAPVHTALQLMLLLTGSQPETQQHPCHAQHRPSCRKLLLLTVTCRHHAAPLPRGCR
jgi:hypothetical protein